MASHSLAGLKVAFLITDGFEQVEMTEPRNALDDAGAESCSQVRVADSRRTPA